MTKAELLEFLKPFVNDVEIKVHVGSVEHSIDRPRYHLPSEKRATIALCVPPTPDRESVARGIEMAAEYAVGECLDGADETDMRLSLEALAARVRSGDVDP